MNIDRRSVGMLALTVLLTAGCAGVDTAKDREERPGSREHDALFEQLARENEAWQAWEREDADRRYLEHMRKGDGRLYRYGLWRIMKMKSVEKAEVLAYLDANPLDSEGFNLVARAFLGEEEAVDGIIAVLEAGDAERAPDILHALGQVDWKELPRLYAKRGELLLPLLDHPDGKVRTFSAFSLEAQEESFWWEPVRERILDESYPGRPRLASMFEDTGNLEAIGIIRLAMERRGSESPDSFLSVLRRFAERKDPLWHERGLEALFQAIESDRPEECYRSYLYLFRQDPLRTLPLAEKYLFHVMEQGDIGDTLYPGIALRGWAGYRGYERQDLLRDWSSHPVMGHIALKALAGVNAGSEDAALARRLYHSAVENKDRYSFSALLAIGGEESTSLALKLLGTAKSLDFEDFIALRWAMKGITLERACGIARRYGLLDEIPGRDAMTRIRMGMAPYDRPIELWLAILAHYGRAASIPLGESTELGHDRLILESFGKAGAGIFDPLRAVQGQREAEEFDIAFEQNGRLYRFKAVYRGGYDVEPVVAAINGALADDGRDERFQEIVTGGGRGFYVLATPGNLGKVAEELFLITEENREEAIGDYGAFREQIMNRIAESKE